MRLDKRDRRVEPSYRDRLQTCDAIGLPQMFLRLGLIAGSRREHRGDALLREVSCVGFLLWREPLLSAHDLRAGERCSCPAHPDPSLIEYHAVDVRRQVFSLASHPVTARLQADRMMLLVDNLCRLEHLKKEIPLCVL